MQKLIENSIEEGMTYQDYNTLIVQMASAGKTTGLQQTQDRIRYTKLNASRMKRLDKTTVLSDEDKDSFKRIDEKQTWLVLIESWCADGAQTIPILNKIVEAIPNLTLKILLRDENPALMFHFLTRGTQSIPKLIVVDQDSNVVCSWGPRSKAATELVESYKKEHGRIDASFKEKLQIWYNEDKGKAILEDLAKVIISSMAFEEDFDFLID